MPAEVVSATASALPDTVPVYPNGRGRYALGHPDGEVLRPGQDIEIVLAGFQLAGTVQKSDLGDYFLLNNGDRCGLCAGMRVVARAQEVFQIEDVETSQLREEYRLNAPEAAHHIAATQLTKSLLKPDLIRPAQVGDKKIQTEPLVGWSAIAEAGSFL